MAKSPAVLFYTSDFMVGTMFMNNEQVGKYIRLLCMQHQQGHLTKKQFFTICNENDQEILNKFETDKQGNYYNKRMDLETQKRDDYSKSRKQNVLKGLKKQGQSHDSICSTYVKHMDNENDNINDNVNISIIIDYLNNRIDTNYKPNSKIAIKNITARLKDGYTIDDFKKVIDKKAKEWLGTDFEKFLTPDTLFGNKFEMYLNQKRKKTLDEIVEEME